MAQSIYITSTEGLSGKSTIVLGVLDALSRSTPRVGVFRAIARSIDERDYVLEMLLDHIGVDLDYEEAVGVTYDDVRNDPDAALSRIVEKVAPWGWHVVIYFEAQDLPDLYDFFSAIPTDVVVDHMGRPDVTKDVDGEEFGLFLRFLRENANVWTKVSCPERLSVTGPRALDGEQHAYTDVVPFARRVVEEFPDRVLWGTDWPHPNLKDHMPDDGLLVDYIPQIATTAELQRKLLVDNPLRLYWPELSREGA